MFFFFFQAEDGIRDLVRSRGLGDVYKRQTVTRISVLIKASLPTGLTTYPQVPIPVKGIVVDPFVAGQLAKGTGTKILQSGPTGAGTAGCGVGWQAPPTNILYLSLIHI